MALILFSVDHFGILIELEIFMSSGFLNIFFYDKKEKEKKPNRAIFSD